MTAQDPLVGTVLGGCRVQQLLGRGGMGSVYAAIQVDLDRRVALKVLSRELADDPDFVARFEREARAVARINDPHVVQVYFAGHDGPHRFLAMEFVEGRSLRERLAQRGALPVREACAIGQQVAQALVAAHAQQVIHRDIKPDNILMAADGRLLVADFGLAKHAATRAGLTRPGQAMGTPAYMSPEQCEGVPADARTDVYSLGIVIWEMLAGRRPFDAETPMAILMKHIREPLPDLRAVAPHVPESLVRLLEWMTAKAPADRCPSAADALAGLVAAERELAQAPPPAPALEPTWGDLVVEDPAGAPRAWRGPLLVGLAVAAVAAAAWWALGPGRPATAPGAGPIVIGRGPPATGALTLRFQPSYDPRIDPGTTAGAPVRPADLDAAARIVADRLRTNGIESSVWARPTGVLEVVVPPREPGPLADLLRTLQARGTVEFRLVAPEDLAKAWEDPAAPPGFAWMPFHARARPNERALIQLADAFNVAGAPMAGGTAGRDQMESPMLTFTVKDDYAARLGELTAQNIDREMAIIMDGRILSKAVIRERIGSAGMIRGGFTEAEIEALAALCNAPRLPVALRRLP